MLCFYAPGQTNEGAKDGEEKQNIQQNEGTQDKGIYDWILCYMSASIRFIILKYQIINVSA